MVMLADEVLDGAVNYIDTNCENLYLCSQEPTTFTEAATTYKLATKASPTIAVGADRTGGGRQVTISAITDGTVNTTGTATHYALTDDSASLLLATEALASSQALTSGNTFTLTAFEIGVPDPS